MFNHPLPTKLLYNELSLAGSQAAKLMGVGRHDAVDSEAMINFRAKGRCTKQHRLRQGSGWGDVHY
jgi:hypothetical protein